jgi:hypothetical protein
MPATVKKKKPVVRKKSSPVRLNSAMKRVVENAELLSRSMLGSRLGVQFGGARDLYETFGYTRWADFTTYKNLYDRHGLGHRAIKKFADSTWNKLPVLIDGDQRSDALDKGATSFLKEWTILAKRLGVSQVMRQADIMCQIGKYSILFLGSSGEDYSQPVKKSDGLFYIAAYDENQSQIQSLISDAKNEKFGMPETYTVQFQEIDLAVPIPTMMVGGNQVHHTRAIHISEDRLGSRVYGTPRLQAPLNRLFDLEKVTGGGAEAAWLAVWGGMLFSTQEGIDLPTENSEEGKFLAEQMQKYFHRMQRYAILKGLDVNNLGSQAVNIEQIYGVLKEDFAGTIGVPQRILFGSERGELASSQDMHEWNSTIDTRRTNFAEPEVLYPFIDWCIKYGVLPPPSSGEYRAEWFPVYSMTQIEQANYANALATGANTITGGTPEMALDVNEWRAKAGLPVRKEEEMEEIEQEQEEEKEKALEEQMTLMETRLGNSNNGSKKKEKLAIK